ncbi:quinolinate synthase NadA [bacterium]|nr:quinolinate synthase NadA [bacterium]
MTNAAAEGSLTPMSATLTVRRPELPPSLAAFKKLGNEELVRSIESAKAELGKSLVILGHHYQVDDVIRFADFTGDSFKLAREAADVEGCRWIVFCGVHFMAETADILTRPEVEVILPDLSAGCSMADMADRDSVRDAWQDLDSIVGADDILPVTYMNSTADLKAFCGRHGGIVCTSSNARAVLEWAWARKRRVLFFPDQHLGRNTAKAMGVPLDEMIVWDPHEELGGNDEAAIRKARIVLWKGHCSVHQMFLPEHIDAFRARDPEVRILVHPECRMEVVDKADVVGSTEGILKVLREAPAGSRWAVGTELHMVNRAAKAFPDKKIDFLSPMVCLCATMYRIDLPHLAWALDELRQGRVVNRIQVDEDTAHWARVALERMLAVK